MTAPAATPPLSTEPPPVVDLEAFERSLARGRELDKQGDYQPALAAYRAALAAKPDDARALSELGWTAFKAGDLKTAKQATESSIAATEEPEVKAASLYNLGRILERQDAWDGARTAYLESQALRPHRVVKRRLKFVKQRLAAPAVLRPELLKGPYGSLPEACRAWLDELEKTAGADAQPASDSDCFPDEDMQASSMTGPILEARILRGQYEGLAEDEQFAVALATKAGWFRSPDIAESPEVHTNSFTVSALLFSDIAGSQILHVASITYETSPADEGGWEEYYWEAAVFCGIGLARIPSCTPSIAGIDGPDKVHHIDDLKPELRAGNKLRLTRLGKKELRDDSPALLGTHVLTFP